MTNPDGNGTQGPRYADLTLHYTVEELAVVAGYFDLDHLPGVRQVELTTATRSLAARTLLARNILVVDGEQVAIMQPHAQLLSAMVDNALVTQVEMATPTGPWRTTLFQMEEGSVMVEEPYDEGIVVVALHRDTCRAVIDDSLGLTAPDGAAARPMISAIDLVTLSRADGTHHVTHERFEAVNGAWGLTVDQR